MTEFFTWPIKIIYNIVIDKIFLKITIFYIFNFVILFLNFIARMECKRNTLYRRIRIHQSVFKPEKMPDFLNINNNIVFLH